MTSHVVCEASCSACNPNATTRMTRHQKHDSPVGQHVNECCGSSNSSSLRIIDQFSDTETLIHCGGTAYKVTKTKIKHAQRITVEGPNTNFCLTCEMASLKRFQRNNICLKKRKIISTVGIQSLIKKIRHKKSGSIPSSQEVQSL